MRIYEGGYDAFDAMTYGQVHQKTIEFVSDYAERASRQLTDIGREWVDKASNLYRWVNESEAMRIVRSVGRRAKYMWRSNDVSYLDDIGKLQTAKPLMQRYLMAEPDVRRLYHAQKCEGYADSYIDVHGKVYGDDHYDYRRVMNGVVTEREGSDRYVSNNYFEELREDDRELVLDEQVDIHLSWEALRRYIAKKNEDPTSLYNGSLG